MNIKHVYIAESSTWYVEAAMFNTDGVNAQFLWHKLDAVLSWTVFDDLTFLGLTRRTCHTGLQVFQLRIYHRNTSRARSSHPPRRLCVCLGLLVCPSVWIRWITQKVVNEFSRNFWMVMLWDRWGRLPAAIVYTHHQYLSLLFILVTLQCFDAVDWVREKGIQPGNKKAQLSVADKPARRLRKVRTVYLRAVGL